ncbi:MAG: amino acid ABC transporter substrate-binding protein [Deltaproteobacteria bacterium]|nr:amino acid ABC transporter substrate-binding protein [Deltaproteobacteria bacterium]
MKRVGFLCFVLLAFLICFPIGSQAQLKAGDPVIIGVPTYLGSIEGGESLKAVQMAADEINAKGGITIKGAKHLIKIEASEIRDGAPGVPVPEALLGIEKIILDKKVHAIVVGPFRSEALLATMDLLAKYKVPMLGTIAMTPVSEAKIIENPEKYKYVFRTCLTARYFVNLLTGVMTQLNKEFGFKKAYLMNQDVLWARGTVAGLKTWYEKSGWEVTGGDEYPTGASDFSSGLMKAKAKEAQLLFTCFDMSQSGILVKQYKSMKVPALMAGFISPMAGEVGWKTFDGQIGGVLNAIFELGNIPSDKHPPAKAFYDAYKKKYKDPLQSGHGPAPAYESVYVLKEAIERAGTIEPDALVAAIKQTDRQGVMGRVKFDKGNQVVYGTDLSKEAVAVMFQWSEAGERRIVYPSALAEKKIWAPEWVLKPGK